MIILHCAQKNDWDTAVSTGTYSANTGDTILCYDPAKITPENFSLPTIQTYVILCINSDSVDNEVTENGDSFTIHGNIKTTDVIATLNYNFDSNDKFVITDEINDIKIINEVLNALNITYSSHKYFRDGTSSRIILLNDMYVIKQNDSALLESELLFSNSNPSPKLQHVIYADDNFKYIVYNYIPGDVMHTVDDIDDLFANIKEITSSYADYDGDAIGYLSEPASSWSDFFKGIVHNQSLVMPESFDYLPTVYEAIKVLEKYPFKKKIIHGDFGAHNFIKLNGKFVGAIDPIPIAGDPLYDLIYASISNVELLNKVNVKFLAELSGEEEEKVKAMLTIVLFCRLAICAKHQKNDLDTYMEYWYNFIQK